jgi:hypothetical protein
MHADKTKGTVASLVCVALSMLAPNIANAASGEQHVFSVEDETVTSPASIPSEVIPLLAQDSEVKAAVVDEHIATDAVPTSWFLATEIHLGKPSEKDLIVISKGPLIGANVTTFWIFRPTNRGYELLLMAPAHTLVINEARTNGYRNIELASSTAVAVSNVLCRFRGGKYIR